MAVPQSRKLKLITFTLVGTEFQCQLQNWQIINNTEDGERFFTYCGAADEGEFREEAEDDYALELNFFSDWRLNGISDFLTVNDQITGAFVIDHHPNIAAEHVRWSGNTKIKAPTVGGEVRTTEMTAVTLPIIGKPTYARV